MKPKHQTHVYNINLLRGTSLNKLYPSARRFPESNYERKRNMPKTIGSTFAHGELFVDTDSLLLNTGNDVIPLDFPFDFDQALVGQNISVVGHTGISASSPREELIVAKLASHEAIAQRAFEIDRSGQAKSAVDNWLTAERELLGLREKR